MNWTLLGHTLALVASLVLLPPLMLGVIRVTKARLQNRQGPRIWQPYFDLAKLFAKDETISRHASWIFRLSAAINLSVILMVAVFVPWLSYQPVVAGADLFLIVYLFALARLLTMLAALDTASSFGAFGASREATLALLVEPAGILALAALAVIAGTSDLSVVFSFANLHMGGQSCLWLLVGTALLLASLVELSRMPIDDPTTHLELTMVHEAMILEASGKNLALVEFAHSLRLTVLFGLVSQCYLHALPWAWAASGWQRGLASLFLLLAVAMLVAVFEGLAVKLQWRKVPEFIAYALTMSFLAVLWALGGIVVR